MPSIRHSVKMSLAMWLTGRETIVLGFMMENVLHRSRRPTVHMTLDAELTTRSIGRQTARRS